MSGHNLNWVRTEGTRRFDIRVGTRAQYACSNQPRRARPEEDSQNQDDIPLARPQIDADQDNQRQKGKDQDEVCEAHEDGVDPAAEISAHQADQCANRNRNEGDDQTREQRCTRARDQLTEQILPQIVGPQDICFTRFLQRKSNTFGGIVRGRDTRKKRKAEHERQDQAPHPSHHARQAQRRPLWRERSLRQRAEAWSGFDLNLGGHTVSLRKRGSRYGYSNSVMILSTRMVTVNNRKPPCNNG